MIKELRKNTYIAGGKFCGETNEKIKRVTEINLKENGVYNH